MKQAKMVEEFSIKPIVVMGVVTLAAYVVGSLIAGGVLL